MASLVPAGPRSLSAELLSGQFTVGVRGRKACRSQLGDTHTALWVHTHTDPSWLSPPSCLSYLLSAVYQGMGLKWVTLLCLLPLPCVSWGSVQVARPLQPSPHSSCSFPGAALGISSSRMEVATGSTLGGHAGGRAARRIAAGTVLGLLSGLLVLGGILFLYRKGKLR